MEKFHKYCLSVLLVIICSNISAQISSGNAESEDCKQLYELYHQILNHHDQGSQNVSVEENAGQNFAISQKHNAIDLIGKIFKGHKNRTFYKSTSGTDFSQKEKYDHLLKNFETRAKENGFARTLYFKIKVSKVRNKDYLSVVG